MQDYREILKDLLVDINYVDRDRFSKDDFVTIICPEHGIYYKTVRDVLEDNFECHVCNFLDADSMAKEFQETIKVPDSKQDALFYRIRVEHKKTGLIFQKIGISKSLQDFNDFWNQWKWKDFKIEPIVKIECSQQEADKLQRAFQEKNQDLKITLPNELKFNLNKTYIWDGIWQAKSKTIPVLRDILLSKQKGKCTVCGNTVKAPTLDHMHIKHIKGTGYIRSVCCSQCNTFIARSENNAARHGISNKDLPNVLRNMADHLENQTKIIHPTEVPKRKKVGVREWNKVKKYYFKVFPNRRTLPDKPTYVTDNWLKLKKAVDDYLYHLEQEKKQRKLQKNKK